MLVGIILASVGLGGFVGFTNAISNDRRYTYSPPFTEHETMMISALVVCMLLLVAGIITIIFSAIKKANADKLRRLENMQGKSGTTGVCPHCGLNVGSNVQICPKCGKKITEEEEP